MCWGIVLVLLLMGSGAFARTVLTMFPEAVQTSTSNIRDEEIVLATLAL